MFIIGYSAFAILAVVGLIFWKNKYCGKKLDLFSIFTIFYILLFCMGPLHAIIFGHQAIRQKYAFEKWGVGDLDTLFFIVGSYCAFVAGFLIFFQSQQAQRKIKTQDFERHFEWLAPRFVSWGFLITGLIGVSVQCYILGGPFSAIVNADAFRTGSVHLESKWIFLTQLNQFIPTGFMLVWANFLDLSKSKKLRHDHYLELTVFSALFIFTAALTHGRRDLVYPVAICFLVSTFSGNRPFSRVHLWLLACSSLWFAVYSQAVHPPEATTHGKGGFLERILEIVSRNYWATIQGINDSFIHLVGMQRAEFRQFGFLKDLVDIPYSFVPSRLLGQPRGRGILEETSEYFLGYKLPVNSTGEEPFGLHGYLLVNFGYAASIFLFFLLGLLFFATTSWIKSSTEKTKALFLLPSVLFLVIWMEYFRDGMLVFILKFRAAWLMAAFLILFFSIFTKRQSNESVQH